MLLGHGLYFTRNTGLLGGGITNSVQSTGKWQFSVSFRRTYRSDLVSFPVGYHDKARILPVKYGGISCFIQGQGALAPEVTGAGVLASALTGSGLLTATGAMGRNLECVISGTTALTAPIEGKGILACLISIGAQPSAFDIAQAVMLITPAAVWNAPATEFNLTGTMGEKLNQGGGGADPGVIADAVWNEIVESHGGEGSTGETLTDIKAKTDKIGTRQYD